MSHRIRFTYLIICIAIFSMIWSLSKGSTSIPFYQLLFGQNPLFSTIFLEFRLPRTLAAFTTGALLGLSGQLTQLLLQNPLADPYVLGIASGAALTTLILMFFGASSVYLLGGASIGSLSTILLILFLARKHRFQTPYLLLSGIAINCGFAALITCLLLLSEDKNLHSMLFWLAGDLSEAPMPWIEMLILCAALLLCKKMASSFDLLTRGENAARALGLNYNRNRLMLYLLSSILTAAAVTLAGCIGFIGLIIPHISRKLVGYHHRYSLPVSALLGGTLLTIADTLARSLIAPLQLPVGMLMALLGVPFFISMLYRQETWITHPTPPRIQSPPIQNDKSRITLKINDLILIRNKSRLFPPLSFTIKTGEIWGVLGANGSGKTTLLHSLCGLNEKKSGRLSLNDVDLTSLSRNVIAKNIGILFQTLEEPFAQTVFDYCLAARFPHLTNMTNISASDEAIIWHALTVTDLISLAACNINQLSGGERRRASIAAVLAQTPNLFLLDEPSNHLDMRHQTMILDYFHSLATKQKAGVVMSLHDINTAQTYCTHCLLLTKQHVFHGEKATVLTEEKISLLYDQPMKRFQQESLVYWHVESAILSPSTMGHSL